MVRSSRATRYRITIAIARREKRAIYAVRQADSTESLAVHDLYSFSNPSPDLLNSLGVVENVAIFVEHPRSIWLLHRNLLQGAHQLDLFP